ncbi:MAG: M20/M25/M40 family metallo-hydrolase [Bacteriovoracaceae bacterium]|jgi:bacterial leucyl aminopeptidase|nr:M20/M25/M40 family metallo-hydrolase [Bacteriovoracaceae bacterium]
MNSKLLLILVFILSFSSTSFAGAKKWITIGKDASSMSLQKFNSSMKELKSNSDISIIEIDEDDVNSLSHEMHEQFNRCGGFIFHDSLEAAEKELNNIGNKSFATKSIFADYAINQNDIVRPLVAAVTANNIKNTIEKLSTFNNRYYKSQTGVASQKFVKETWEGLVSGRSDAKVEYFQHRAWAQPSVILTITGSKSPKEVIVIGGHADSIAGYFGGSRARAPGADDNASGISTITEVIRVLVAGNYQPDKTIKFMGYAAEEVGLRGSKEIAQSFNASNANVIGVMQLDMTNFNGSDLDIVMMTDFTNANQNAFIGNIIDEYVSGVSWGYDKCGYACSDHASWTNAGFPASMPFEAKKRDMNRNIHTSRDTISQSRNTASHAAKFARMAVAFAVELDK